MNLSILASETILAAVGNEQSATDFFSKGFGSIIQSIFTTIGILVVVIGLFLIVRNLFSSKPGAAFKNFAICLIIAVICFDLSLPFGLVAGIGSLVGSIFETINGWFSSAG